MESKLLSRYLNWYDVGAGFVGCLGLAAIGAAILVDWLFILLAFGAAVICFILGRHGKGFAEIRFRYNPPYKTYDVLPSRKPHFHEDERGILVKCYHGSRALIADWRFWLGLTIGFPLEHFLWTHVWPFKLFSNLLGLE